MQAFQESLRTQKMKSVQFPVLLDLEENSSSKVNLDFLRFISTVKNTLFHPFRFCLKRKFQFRQEDMPCPNLSAAKTYMTKNKVRSEFQAYQ